MSEAAVTLLVAAEAREFSGLMQHVRKSERLAWPVQYARRVECRDGVAVLAANGPGPELAAEATRVAIERERVGTVVSTGFCGALDPTLVASDIFIALRLNGGGPLNAPEFTPAKSHRSGALISTNRVAITAAEKAGLRKTGGDAVEMEAAGVAECALFHSIPFYCVRVVTDTADENLPLDFNQMRDSAGRFSRFQIIAAGLRNPGNVFPKLIALNQRCKTASRTLGEFLVNCRF